MDRDLTDAAHGLAVSKSYLLCSDSCWRLFLQPVDLHHGKPIRSWQVAHIDVGNTILVVLSAKEMQGVLVEVRTLLLNHIDLLA